MAIMASAERTHRHPVVRVRILSLLAPSFRASPTRRDYTLPNRASSMQLSTTDTIPGATINESLGLVKGNTVRARNIGRDLTQSLRNIAGGELKAYSGLMSRSRDEAVDRMIEAADELGADAVVSVRFETSQIAQGAAELLAYGTAVTIE